jgi:hypothetical protein
MNLLVCEMRRALHRRVVTVLIVLALMGCVVAGVMAFVASAGKSVAELQAGGQHRPAVMRDWWIPGSGEGTVVISFLFLILGGFFGGASVAGAEWRAGTVTTVLSWEPRRVRLHLTRTAACAILAALISLALQTIFLASLLPAVLVHGSRAGVDAAWLSSLALGMLRSSLLTAIAAMLGVALATLGRNTAFAIVTVFTWLAVIEGVVRGLKPGLARYLWGENIATVLPWSQLDHVDFRRGPVVALATVALYVTVITVVATIVFRRRDIASVS